MSEFSSETLNKLRIKPQEYARIKELLGRNPNFNELCMFSVMWSEHCAYKYTRNLLKNFPVEREDVVSGPGENAGIIKINDHIQIAFKIESHNHPTAVEPYEGAATGVGGILRDIFTMGARPIALLNSLRFGPINNKRNKYLFERAVEGIANYGNCTGIPTVGGECYFDECYTGNPLLNVMSAGIIYDNNIIYSGTTDSGDSVIYAGQTTGRDGMAGASFASAELSGISNESRPAVQVGDPFSEKILMEACLEAFKTGHVKAAQDMGAAGLTCSMCEIASKGDTGIEINLDLVPTRGNSLKPFEFLMSESQERMVLVVEPQNEDQIFKIFKKWGVPAVSVGKITNDKTVKVLFKGERIVDVPAKFFTDLAPEYFTVCENESKTETTSSSTTDISIDKINDIVFSLFGSANLCSKKFVYHQFDRKVQNNTILDSENNCAGIISIKNKDGTNSGKGITLSTDCNSAYVKSNPYVGSMVAVVEGALNTACVGASPSAITNNLNFGSPEKPLIYNQLQQSIKGISEACRTLNLVVTGGNVSLYNETEGVPIFPTPVIGTLGILENIESYVTPQFKESGDLILLLGNNHAFLNSSEYENVSGDIFNDQISEPDLNLTKNIIEFLSNKPNHSFIKSAQDISEGGLFYTICECAMLSGLGANIHNEILHLSGRMDLSLFGEGYPRVLITISAQDFDLTDRVLGKYKIPYTIVGKVSGSDVKIAETDVAINLDRLKCKWENTLQNIMSK